MKEVSPSPLVKYGTSFVPENEKALEWKDYLSMMYTNDADARESWPNDCKEVVLEYINTSTEMVQKLLQILIGSLGVKLDDSRLHELMGFNLVNMNFYPPCPNPDLTIGVGSHSDAGMLTVLLQDGIGGLYVKKGDQNASLGNEVWVEIPPMHGALVINVGDSLQVRHLDAMQKLIFLTKQMNNLSLSLKPTGVSQLASLTPTLHRDPGSSPGTGTFGHLLPRRKRTQLGMGYSPPGTMRLGCWWSVITPAVGRTVNGRYISAEHRVRTTDVESRVSVPRFIAPLLTTKIGPFPELVACDGVARYKEVIYGEYLKNYFEKSLDGKKSLDFASI
ncbi:putative oxoglutarate/iron-dependent dioxygenase, isopenicillin N synthase [Helianthus debilis subsp. tardiflorus]